MKFDDQLSMMEEIDAYEEQACIRKLAEIRHKLQIYYTNPEYIGFQDLPDGLVVINEKSKYKGSLIRTVFYRCVVDHHMAVGGLMMHLISAPNEEWPEEPTWQPSHGTRWTYPDGRLYTKKEPEYDHSIRWGGKCAECYKHCDDCKEVTGPYPRIRR